MINKNRIRIVACCACVTIVFVGGMRLTLAQQPIRTATANGKFAKANERRLKAFVVLLRLRHDLFLKWKETGKWPDDKEANAALAAHGEYWSNQLKDGRRAARRRYERRLLG